MPWELIGPTLRVVGLRRVPITIEGEGRKSTFRVEGIAEGCGDTFKNPLTGKNTWQTSTCRTVSSGSTASAVRARFGRRPTASWSAVTDQLDLLRVRLVQRLSSANEDCQQARLASVGLLPCPHPPSPHSRRTEPRPRGSESAPGHGRTTSSQSPLVRRSTSARPRSHPTGRSRPRGSPCECRREARATRCRRALLIARANPLPISVQFGHGMS